tara:strand:- start:767 stop:946 length:180 start_codon:yes stop_codon:yes gene_type:complete
MTNTNYKTEEPSYTDVIYERLEKKARQVVRLEKEIKDKEDEIKMMQHRIDFMKNAMAIK